MDKDRGYRCMDRGREDNKIPGKHPRWARRESMHLPR